MIMRSIASIKESSFMTSLLSSTCATSLPLRQKSRRVYCSHVPSPSLSTESGLAFDGIVQGGRVRLDSWIASQLPSYISRARVQSSIRLGLAFVNGQPVDKISYSVRSGDHVECTIAALTPLRAEPEQIDLDIVFEDEHVLVVNKPAHMVTHPAPGNWNGTLVNALVHHCKLPTVSGPTGVDLNDEDYSDTEDEMLDRTNMMVFSGVPPAVRPGIVHRLDKGTSGLLVIAKDEHAHEHLSKQFKDRTVNRSYLSLTCGSPNSKAGCINAAIGRDIHNRTRMAVISHSTNRMARNAVSGYEVVEILVNGGAALVEWKLETGRTHQIRVHAQYLGHPLLGDDLYGGTKGAALSFILPKISSSAHGKAKKIVSQIQRPCLHAATLGFIHPRSLERLTFSCPLPPDIEELWLQLKSFDIAV
ncbi:hypothetical protein KP509_04G009400 [Ceratopteris richardii]|uniref:Pseudouridine synthase n=1 Tax=Ceratopteris richardii TaxID=49495 RepID=A0A8T2UX51_CERRI|nr:hypothetical protein KP509_04G009400 [Ceratopteris richardii]